MKVSPVPIALALLASLSFAAGANSVPETKPQLKAAATASVKPVESKTANHSGNPVSITETKIDKKTFHVGSLTLNAPPQKVWEILTDYKSAPKIFSSLKNCELVSQKGGKHQVAMTSKTGVGPITVSYVLELTPTGNTRLDYKRLSGAFKAYEGYWNLESADGGKKTLVTYAKHVNGGLFYPEPLVKKALKDSIPVVLSELKTRAEQPHVVAMK